MKLISNQINPHFKLSDSLAAAASIVFGAQEKTLDQFFEQKFCTKNILLTNAARSALGLICDTVKPDRAKRIGLPAFICAVVATPFLSRGYTIEWIDTDEHGLIDVKDFERKAANIGLVVVPHIFGQVAPVAEIKAIAQLHDIFVVEDGAHYIPQLTEFKLPKDALSRVRTQPQLQSDALILSFGREKVISCVSGGALIWPENSPFAADFEKQQQILPKPSLLWMIQHALQPLVFSLSLPWWHRGGKVTPWLFRGLKLLPLAVTAAEKNGREDIPVAKLGLPQKRILSRQLRQFDSRLLHAQAMALAWKTKLETLYPDRAVIIPPLAFRALIQFASPSEKEAFLEALPTPSRFHLDDWTGVPISPSGISYHAFGYRPGQCPKAEYFARTYLTFPTNCRVEKREINAFA